MVSSSIGFAKMSGFSLLFFLPFLIVFAIPEYRKWQPTPVFLPGESCGQRSLVGYSPGGCNHLSLCCPLLLLPSVFPSIRVFSNESVIHIRWPEYWSFSFNINPSKEYSGLIFFRMDWLNLLAVQRLSRVFSNITVQNHQFFGAQLSL